MLKKWDRFKVEKEFNQGLFIKEFNTIVGFYGRDDEESYTMMDVLSEVGDLCNRYNVTSDHLKSMIESGLDQFKVLSILYDETLELEKKKSNSWDEIFERLSIKCNNFDDFWTECEKIKSEYKEPIKIDRKTRPKRTRERKK